MPLLPSRMLEMRMNFAGNPSCLVTIADDAAADSRRVFDGLPRAESVNGWKNSKSLQSLVRGRNSSSSTSSSSSSGSGSGSGSSCRGIAPRGVSSLPLEAELSSNCWTYPDFSRPRDDGASRREWDTIYHGASTARRHSSMKKERERVGTAEEEAAESEKRKTRDSRAGQGGFAVAASGATSGATIEREPDNYVVDPVRGNGYCKGQFLGKGGFARVYLMTDVSNGNRYACKIIPKNRMQKIHMQKIAREIMIHRELNHVNVVQMHHYFEDNANVYMLLEACPRKSLMHVLKYRGKVTEPEARYYMKQMVTGVAYIHSQRVVHRDLKPGNMFLSDRMIVKIGDFGLATRPDGQRRRVTICGTPNYIAPEVLCKQAYSYEADVWALGCILYALLVGRPPFDTATLKETYARICSNQYRPLDDTIATRNGQDLIKCLLQLNPQLRPSLERVKEHVYLTEEYVPSSLPHTCCYRQPNSLVLNPATGSSLTTSSAASSVSASASSNSSSTGGGGGGGGNVPFHTPQTLSGRDAVSLRRQDHRRVPSLQQQEEQQRTAMGSAMMTATPPTAPPTATSVRSNDRSRKTQGNKKPKVAKWLARRLPKLPKFRERLSSVLCPERKKGGGLAASASVEMHRAVERCVFEIEGHAAQNPPSADRNVAPLFVTKWIDYSNKYGLSFQLSDKSVGVLFNDNTKMSYAHDRRRVEYMTSEDEVTRFHREGDVPAALQTKLDLLRHFTQYMDNFLTEGGETRECLKRNGGGGKGSKNDVGCVPRMRRWLRTDKAIAMELTVPLLQVNFFLDHTKMVVSREWPARDYLVTYIDTGRRAFSYWLDDLRAFGCTPDLYERLRYVSEVTREFAQLDDNAYV